MAQKDELKEALWRAFQALQNNENKTDITLKGSIKTVLENNTYTVQLGEAVYTIKSCLDITFTAGEAVWVTVPRGNYSDMFICGRRR